MSESQSQNGGASGPIVVQKYGGSSVATTARIKAVAQRIKATVESGKRVCVVVSAMANTTDELLAKAREISSAPPRRELDMLLSCGERASMALLSMAVMELGLEAISFTGSQCGIMTNDRHWGAEIVEVRPFRVVDELERGRVVIVAGFQGVSYKREITTLGRGGSDTTAVALAAALGAEYCEICSDVDGVYTADPRVVDAAELLERISHDEMLELASHGARVLAPAAIEFAKRSSIALWARGTSSDGRGTRIDAQASRSNHVGVTGRRDLHLVRASGRDAIDGALSTLAAAGVGLVAVELSAELAGERATLIVDPDEAPDWSSVALALMGHAAAVASIGEVSVVGGGVGKRPDAAARVTSIASEAKIALSSVVASPLRLTVTCNSDDVDQLTRLLHNEFVERG